MRQPVLRFPLGGAKVQSGKMELDLKAFSAVILGGAVFLMLLFMWLYSTVVQARPFLGNLRKSAFYEATPVTLRIAFILGVAFIMGMTLDGLSKLYCKGCPIYTEFALSTDELRAYSFLTERDFYDTYEKDAMFWRDTIIPDSMKVTAKNQTVNGNVSRSRVLKGVAEGIAKKNFANIIRKEKDLLRVARSQFYSSKNRVYFYDQYSRELQDIETKVTFARMSLFSASVLLFLFASSCIILPVSSYFHDKQTQTPKEGKMTFLNGFITFSCILLTLLLFVYVSLAAYEESEGAHAKRVFGYNKFLMLNPPK
jgi:hypothetical protein